MFVEGQICAQRINDIHALLLLSISVKKTQTKFNSAVCLPVCARLCVYASRQNFATCYAEIRGQL